MVLASFESMLDLLAEDGSTGSKITLLSVWRAKPNKLSAHSDGWVPRRRSELEMDDGDALTSPSVCRVKVASSAPEVRTRPADVACVHDYHMWARVRRCVNKVSRFFRNASLALIKILVSGNLMTT
jgi:hypothetical protein